MICPYCETENRDERDRCYHCEKDLSMLRLIVNKAKHHYNLALEHAERGRNKEAIVELQNALDLDSRHVNAHVVLGTIYAREENFDKAEEHWQKALQLNPAMEKAHSYLGKSLTLRKSLPALRMYRNMAIVLWILFLGCLAWLVVSMRSKPGSDDVQRAFAAYQEGRWGEAQQLLDEISEQNVGREDKRLANSLQAIIQDSVQNHLDAAEGALRVGDYSMAMEDLEFLDQKNLSDTYAQRVDNLRRLVPERASVQIEQALTTYRETGQGYPLLRMRLDRLQDAVQKGYLKNIDVPALREEVEILQRERSDEELALIRADWNEGQNDPQILTRTWLLLQSGEQDEDSEVAKYYNRVLGVIRSRIDGQTSSLVSAGRFDEARAVEENALKNFTERLREEIYKGLIPVEEKIQQAQTDSFLDELRQLASANEYQQFIARAGQSNDFHLDDVQFKEILTTTTLFQERLVDERIEAARALAGDEDWTAALEAIADLRLLKLTEEQLQAVDKIDEDVRQKRAQGFIDELVKLDSRFRTAPARRITSETAARVLQQWPDLAAAADENRHRQLAFYRAVSAFVVEDYELAELLFEEFLNTYKGQYVEDAKEYMSLVEERREALLNEQ